ncbi:MAG: ATP synthase protein I [uncultured Rubrobacteraceae bacterium]|uniref:ATP synthase protein I n=1 Tax=uncultured Rubrobacteraceae bacterium TaxID=349277 RepID=A0A6J4QGX6_9ACTN|nr:MAG: ATP synthase protein I [uncultured Rubrobacteraceae bacterium]
MTLAGELENYVQHFAPCCIVRSMPDTGSQRKSTDGNYARFIGLGFTFILLLGVLTAGGFFIDRMLGTLPLFLLLGLGIGFAGSLYYVYLALKEFG